MQFLHFYSRNNQVVIPTVARTEDGFFLDVDPVIVIEISAPEVLREKLGGLLSAENPTIATPSAAPEGERGQSVVLEKIGLKRWDAFEKEATLYTVFTAGDKVHFFVAGRGPDRMWTSSRENELTFSAATPMDFIAGAIVDQIVRERERMKPSRTPLLLGPPADVAG